MKSLRWGACAAFVGLLASAVSGQSPGDAQAMQSAGDWRGAESVWRALVKQHPEDYRLWTSLGITLAHQSNFSEAIKCYVKSLALNPDAAETNLNLGLAYFKSGDLDKAVGPLEKAAGKNPRNPQIETVLGMSLYGTAKYLEAIPHLELARSGSPDNQELEFVIAQAYLWSGEYEKAKLAFQGMLARAPNSPQVQVLLGEAYDGLGRTEDAILAFREAVSQPPVLPEAHFGLGFLLWKTHAYEQAATEFHSELLIDSKNYKALAYLGDCEFELGDLQAAPRHLQEAIEVQDVLWIPHFDLGKIAFREKKYEIAEKQFRRAIVIEPDRAEAHYRIAQVYQALGKTREARNELQAVTRLHALKSDDLILKISGTKSKAP